MELSSVLKTNEAKVVVIVFVVVAVVYEIFTLLFTPSADSNNEKPAEEVVQEAKKGARTKKATKAAGDKDAMEEFMNEALPPTKSSNRGRSKSPAPAQVAKKSAKIIPVRLPSPAPVKVVKSGPTPKKASQFEVGDEVVVAHRSEKGSKIKEGGIGRCIAVEAEKGAWTYSVAYSLGGRGE
jgi:type IV secretory pathway VirB10-like protein